jgi:hypothetical protein
LRGCVMGTYFYKNYDEQSISVIEY